MAKQIHTGRYTTENQEDIVVFVIGMRVNKRLAFHKWLPVFFAMPGMMRELHEHQEELGFLSLENYFGLRTTMMIQYWRSSEDLHAYAKGRKHLTAWKNFNKKIGNTDAVGIYHECYIINNGEYEALYGNMPSFGLSKALNKIPVTKESNSARKRLSGLQLE